MRQVYEHFISKVHQTALQWYSDTSTAPSSEISKTIERKRTSGITDFFKPSSTKLSMVPCLHLWDPQIAEHFKIEGGVKSLDPCCLVTAFPVGDNPYTCSNCIKQKPYLENLLAKREMATYRRPLTGARYGLLGFRHGYMKKSEQVDALTKERISRIQVEN
jgi:hypothetical protein